jgi:tetratricopeptide (TPR) repeat protein
MGKQRKQCWSGKSVNPQKKHTGEKKTPESLMAQGDFQEAIRLLRGHIRATPLDAKKRLLGECLFELGQYQEAAATWLTIQEKVANDLLLLGIAFINIEDWEQAIQFLNESVQREEKGYAYYLLAMAHLKDKLWYSADTKTKQTSLDFLQHARALSECPASGYLVLDHILWSLACEEEQGKDDEVQNQMRDHARKQSGELLEEAFQLYPDDDEVRLKHAKSLIYQKQYEVALEVLTPLISEDGRSEEATAWAINASIGAKLFDKAHQYLDALPSNPNADEQSHEASLIKLRGDLFLYQANFGQALACYEQERQRAAFVDKFIGTFSCARVWLLQEQKEKAIASAKEGAQVWFEHNDSLERYYGLDALPICIGAVLISNEDPALCVKQVCEQLLADDTLSDAALKGQLSYLLYQYHAQCYDHRAFNTWSQQPEARQLLLQASQLYSHPLMSDELMPLFLDMGDVPQAITHHLISRTFFFSCEPGDFEEEYAQFAYEKVSITTEDERRKAHEAAFSALEGCNDTGMIERVFLPFFTSFWRSLLQDGQMIQELVAVTKMLMDAATQVNTVWFYHAWGLSELSQNDEAERIYRQLLEHTPENANALHNLAVLVEKKGHKQEALEFSSRAAKLAVNDKLIVNKYNQLKSREYKEREPIYPVPPELIRRWSSLSGSQKRLLCLLELHPATYWSALLPRIRNEESQVRQLQEDWEWLLAQEVCTQPDAEMPVQVVPQLRPYVWSEGFNYWLAAEIAREQLRRKKDLWLPDANDLEDEQLAVLSETQRDLLQKVLIKHMDRISLSGLEHCFLRFYRDVWKELLIEWKMYSAVVDLCECFLTRLSVLNRQELWECAYYATDLSSWQYRGVAEKRYKEYLAQGESYSAYHNLALIYFRKREYQEALQMIDQALRLEPSKDSGVSLKTNIERAIVQVEEQRRQQELQSQQERERREQRIKDLEQNVQEHLTDVDYRKQNILHSLKNASYFRGKRAFAKYLGMEEWSLEGHWKKLVSWGMIVETDEEITVHPLVCRYLEQGWPIKFKLRDKTPELADNIDRLAQVLTGFVTTSPTRRNEEMQMVKTLFLAANPVSTTRLAIDEEMRAIEQKVRAAEHRDVLNFQSAWAVRPDDLLQKLNECRPHIVHFSGHGSRHGLCLAGDDGLEKLVTTRALTHLFSALKDNIRLVFLNSCYSREQAQALVANIDCVIGMTKSIHDNAAKIFASSFYRAIGFGRSIQEAFDQGIAALLLEDVSDEEVPELLTREGVDPRKIVLIRSSAKLHPELP